MKSPHLDSNGQLSNEEYFFCFRIIFRMKPSEIYAVWQICNRDLQAVREMGSNLYRLTENSKNGVARLVSRKKNNEISRLFVYL